MEKCGDGESVGMEKRVATEKVGENRLGRENRVETEKKGGTEISGETAISVGTEKRWEPKNRSALIKQIMDKQKVRNRGC